MHVIFDPMPSSIEYIKTGRLRALAVTTAMRSDALPDVPALSDFHPWFALVRLRAGLCRARSYALFYASSATGDFSIPERAEDIVSKRVDGTQRSGLCPVWIKVRNPASIAVQRGAARELE